ncbi:MAG: T9SS type A sorting domain-containing protein [Fibrobacteres bacterium]|nr:T9SS type A sorting domain-containing protein [Fibrobacterota bacterium]
MIIVMMVFVAVSMVFSSSAEHFVVDNNTIALWRFNEGAGDSVFDISGNNNHGRFNKAPTWSTASGVKGGGVMFDGALFAKVENPRKVFDLNGSFSLEARVMIPTGYIVHYFRILGRHRYGDNTGFVWGKGGALFEAYDSISQITATSNKVTLSNDIWYELGVHYDSASTKIKYSVNGVIVDSITKNFNKIYYTPMALLIGAELHPDSVGGANFFQGIIDEIKVSVKRTAKPPVFVSNPDTVSLESHLYTYLVNAKDPDSTSVTFSLVSNITGMSLKKDTLIFTPSSGQIGIHNVSIKATTSKGGISFQNFRLHVLPRTAQITFSNIIPVKDSVRITEGDTTVFSISAKSRNFGASITYQWYVNDLLVASDTFFKMVAGYKDAGVAEIKVTTYDGVEFVDKKWTVLIANKKILPVIISPASDMSVNGDSVFRWICLDPDLDSVTTRYDVEFMRNSQPTVPIYTLYALQEKQFVLNRVIQRNVLPENAVLAWRVRAYDTNGDTVPFCSPSAFYYTGYGTNIENNSERELDMFTAIPNPFNPVTVIKLSSSVQFGSAQLLITNMTGRIIKKIKRNEKSNKFEFSWDGTDDAFNRCAGGIYMCTIKTDAFSRNIKILLAK